MMERHMRETILLSLSHLQPQRRLIPSAVTSHEALMEVADGKWAESSGSEIWR